MSRARTTGRWDRRPYRDDAGFDGATRDEVMRDFAPRIAAMARRILGRLPRGATVEFDDLVNSGALGLLEALERYDPERDVRFSTFADFRIRGAMLDVLRRVDPITRQARNTANRIRDAATTLQHELGRAPQPEEIARMLGVELDEYWKMVDDSKPVLTVSFEGQADPSQRPLSEVLMDPDHSTVEERVALREALASMRRAIEEHLTERQRTVLILYYLRDLTLKEIGAVLGVTESRVSQIHTEACLRLRARLDPERAGERSAGRRAPRTRGRRRAL